MSGKKDRNQLFFMSKGEEKHKIQLTAKIMVEEAFEQGGETPEDTI